LFQAYETEPVGFFKILIGFFHGLVFSGFFFGFLGLIGFSIFLLTPSFIYVLGQKQVFRVKKLIYGLKKTISKTEKSTRN